ncbi:MAG TPA: PAS domain S-box protein, partial [Verrucomicrobiales bacterium]|nr:PAS domain S-box protein [Verrucomicrobiales bacterium]
MPTSPSALLTAIIESSDDAIISKNLDGTITSWNRSAERIFGFTAQEAVGKSILIIIPPDRKGEEEVILTKLRAGERIDHFETVRQRKDGTLLDISVTISPIRDDTGEIVGASKVARNVSARKRYDAVISRKSEKLKILNE